MVKKSLMNSVLSGAADRRDVLKALSAAGIGVAAMPLLPTGARAADEAIYFTWGGYDVEEMQSIYNKKHGALPDRSTYGDAEEGFQKVRAGFVADVVHPCSNDVPRWEAAGILQPIDTSRLSNYANVFDTLQQMKAANFKDKTWFVPWEWGFTSITYRTDKVTLPGGEESWGILWDEANKGRIAVIDSAADAWFCTAIYGGVDIDNIDQAAIEKVAGLLRQQRPLVRFYTSDNTQQEQALASGEIYAAMTWADAAVNLIKQGVPVKFARPKEGTLTWVCGLVILKDAPHLDKAYDLINGMLDPEVGEYCLNEFGYGHANKLSYANADAAQLEALGYLAGGPEETLKSGHFQNPIPDDTTDQIEKDWQKIKSGF